MKKECKHKRTTKHHYIAATHLDGNIHRWECYDCGKSFEKGVLAVR